MGNSIPTDLTDTLKDYALKLVANAHSEMADEQWDDWINEHTETYATALLTYIDKEIIGRQKPYKGGNYSYWEGQKFLRQEQRNRLNKRGVDNG